MSHTAMVQDVNHFGLLRQTLAEIFFRKSKNNLGFDTYQVRSATAFISLWALLAFTHLYRTTTWDSG